MNKIFLIVITILSIVFTSCNTNYPTHTYSEQNGVSLVELAIKNDTCEYIMYTTGIGDCEIGGMSHWTYCKFCAARNNAKQNEIRVLTKDCVEVTIYYTGDEISTNTRNNIRTYFHNYLISDVNTENFEDNFYQTFNLENCKFDYNIK